MNELLDLTRREIAPAKYYLSEDSGHIVRFEDGAAQTMFSRFADLHVDVLRRQDGIKYDFIYIAAALDEIERDGLFHAVQSVAGEPIGYTNFYKFCAEVFGFKKRTVQYLLAVYRQFCDEQGRIRIEYSNYSYTQLRELTSMDEALHGRISVKTSARQIHKLNDLYKECPPKDGTTWEDDLMEWERRRKKKLEEKNAKKNAIQFVPAVRPDDTDEAHARAPQEDDQDIVTPAAPKKVKTADVIKGLLAQFELLQQSEAGARWERFCDMVTSALKWHSPHLVIYRSDMDVKVQQLESDIRRLKAATCSTVNPSNDGYTPGKLDLKNKKAREEWLRNYESWGVWIDMPELQMKYYRCNFANGCSLIVAVGCKYEWDYSAGRISDQAHDVVRYALLDEQYQVYDTWGISFTQTVEWLTSRGKDI